MAKEEKAEVGVLVEDVVELIRGGVTGLDLLEVFLSRWIHLLQARSQPMWQYTGPYDPTPTHPEEVKDETVMQWLRSITGARDNPHGSKRVLPFDVEHQPGEVRHILLSVLFFVSNMRMGW